MRSDSSNDYEVPQLEVTDSMSPACPRPQPEVMNVFALDRI